MSAADAPSFEAVRRRFGTAIAAGAIMAALAGAGPGQAAAGQEPSAQASIIGGVAANSNEWPFLVGLRHDGDVFCGGSVIAPTVVLTAAHCANATKGQIVVVAGRSKLGVKSVGEEIRVAVKTVHPDYKRKQRHDLALLFLNRPTTVPPIALPTIEEARAATAPAAVVRAAGYGAKDAFSLLYPRLLKRTTEWIKPNRRCRHAYGGLFKAPAMICSLGRKFKRSVLHSTICAGDSGGPLVADTPAGPRLIGVASYGGIICGWDVYPTVYARVSNALTFIERYSGVVPPSSPAAALPVVPPVT